MRFSDAIKAATDQWKGNDENAVQQNVDVKNADPVPINEPITMLSPQLSSTSTSSLPSTSHLPSSSSPSSSEKALVKSCADSTIQIKAVEKFDSPMLNDVSNAVTMIENIIAIDTNNIPVDDEQNDENILLTTTTDHVPMNSHSLPLANEQIDTMLKSELYPYLDVITEVSEVNSIKEVSEKTIEKSISVCALVNTVQNTENKNDENEQIETKSELSQVTVEYNQSFCDFVPHMVNGNTAFVSPLVIKKLEKQSEEPMYEIKKKNQENCVDYSYSGIEYAIDGQQMAENSVPQQFVAETSAVSQSPIKMPKRVRFPFSPRIILERIEHIRDYQQTLKRGLPVEGTQGTRKSKRVKLTRTECK